MKLRIEIDLDNDAFHPLPAGRVGNVSEVARVLKDLAQYCLREGVKRADEHRIRDVNGNTVGEMTVTED